VRKRHKDLRLYWDGWGWVGNAAKSLRKWRASQMAFYGGCGMPPGKMGELWEVVGRVKRREVSINNEGDGIAGRE
jgi:hypothetical protein